MTNDSKRADSAAQRALLGASALSFVLALVKLVAYLLTGSLVALGSFFDSLGDTAISIINGLAHRHSRKAPDREHPFGHGGIEVLSSFVQGAFLAGLATFLAYQSITRLASGPSAESIDRGGLPIAIVIMLVSSAGGLFINFMMARAQRRVSAHNQRALSLDADKAHYAGDALNNLLSAIGLGVVWYTGNSSVDASFGLVSAAFLMWTALPILRRSTHDIVHREAETKIQSRVRQLVLTSDPRILGMHRLRTRELGPTLFIDFHLVLHRSISLEIAHEIAEHAADRVRAEFPRADVLTHIDPDNEPIEEFGPSS